MTVKVKPFVGLGGGGWGGESKRQSLAHKFIQKANSKTLASLYEGVEKEGRENMQMLFFMAVSPAIRISIFTQ